MCFHVSQAPSQNYGLVYSVCFQGLFQQLEILLIHTYCTSSRCKAMLLKALNGLQEFKFVCCFYLKSVQMVQQIQLLASDIVPTM